MSSKRTCRCKVSNGTSTTRFLTDGDELVAEYDATGTLLRRYVHGASVDDPVAWYEGGTLAGTSLRYLIADRQGSIIAVTDASGNRLQTNAYDEYGVPKTTASTYAEPYGRFAYTGQIWLPEVKLYHYKARIYSPTLGRFLQTDPVGYDDQVNLYAYVGNDPVNKADPKGFYECQASSKQCASIDSAYAQLEKAASSYKQGSKEAVALNGILSTLGIPGEANGVYIDVGALKDGTLGSTLHNENGTTTITMDFNQINAKSNGRGLLLGTVVLAHEGYHAVSRTNGYSTAEQVFREEKRAFTAGALAAKPLGASFPKLGFPDYGSRTFSKDLNRIVKEECLSVVVASGSGLGAMDGHCE